VKLNAAPAGAKKVAPYSEPVTLLFVTSKIDAVVGASISPVSESAMSVPRSSVWPA